MDVVNSKKEEAFLEHLLCQALSKHLSFYPLNSPQGFD